MRIQIPEGITNGEGRQLTVSDIYDAKNETHIRYGSQFVDYIQMGVMVVAGPRTEVKLCPKVTYDAASVRFFGRRNQRSYSWLGAKA
jgi:hypothetical protein